MNSCYLCHFTFLCLSLIFLSDSAAFFFVNLFWFGESIRILKIAGVSFDRWRFKVFYGVSIVLKVFLGQTVSRRTNCIGMKVRSKLTPHHVTRHLFSHTLVLKTFFHLLPFFLSTPLTRSSSKFHKIFCLLYLVKCW